MCIFSYIKNYPSFKNTNDFEYTEPFFAHYLVHFNTVFNLCFYTDYDKISSTNFYDELNIKYINNIHYNYNPIDLNYNNNLYNNHKYFKLLFFMIIFKNIPDDFDVNSYKELNKDLQKLSILEAINHYKNNGIKEKRKYKNNIF